MSTVAVSAGQVSASRIGGAPRPSAARDSSARPPRSATSHHRSRLTRRGRVVLVGLGLALAAAAGSVAGQAMAEGPAVEQATTTVVVAPGESLWTIAQTITAPGEDVRDVVSAIADLNELDGLGLRAGDELLLPAS